MPCYFTLAALCGALCFSFVGCLGASYPPLELTGVWHRVQEGETSESIASKYHSDADAIEELNDTNRTLGDRAEIFVPTADGKPPGRPAPAVAQTEPRPKPPSRPEGRCDSSGKPCFVWPVDGSVSGKFGPRGKKHHDGIDILADKGQAVVAAADGTVLYTGDEIEGYGNLVIVRHENDVITVYAHNDATRVKEGEQVQRGQRIADVGQTGSATRPHLHFEVRVGERPQDPLLYLPSSPR